MNVLYTIASTLRDTVAAQLPATLGGQPVKLRMSVVPGELAWDSCECGLLGIEFTGITYSTTPPTPDLQRDEGCRPYVVANFTVSMLRCVPGPGPRGDSPTVAKLDEAAQVLMDDALAVLKGTTLALQSLINVNTILGFAMNGVTPVGPQGTCAGVTQQVSAYIMNQYGPC